MEFVSSQNVLQFVLWPQKGHRLGESQNVALGPPARARHLTALALGSRMPVLQVFNAVRGSVEFFYFFCYIISEIFFSLFSNSPGVYNRARRPCPQVRPRGHTTQRARGEIFKLSLCPTSGPAPPAGAASDGPWQGRARPGHPTRSRLTLTISKSTPNYS